MQSKILQHVETIAGNNSSETGKLGELVPEVAVCPGPSVHPTSNSAHTMLITKRDVVWPVPGLLMPATEDSPLISSRTPQPHHEVQQHILESIQ